MFGVAEVPPSAMDCQPPQNGPHLGPGPRELRWSLLRVQCWDCWEEPGAWLACASNDDFEDDIGADEVEVEEEEDDDVDIEIRQHHKLLTNSMTDIASTPFIISSGLLSPPVDGGPLNGVEEGAGFYMLKKDSQRRQTIVKVLQEDKDQLIVIWMDKIRVNMGSSSLLINEGHLVQLLSGMTSFIPEQNKAHLSKVLVQLKESLDYDGNAINQLQTALFVFQQSVMEILKRQNIKPHWMFALDNLVKQCCQAAITILSPELAANIIGQNIEEEDDDRASTTSGVSTTNSIRSAQKQETSTGQQMQTIGGNQMTSGAAATSELLGRILGGSGAGDPTTIVTELVQKELEVHGLLLSLLGNRGRLQGSSGETPSTLRALTKDDGDPEMVQWLEGIGLDEESVLKFVQERFSMEDVLQLVDREDLKRLKLKLGYEVRVWTAIQRYRNERDART